MSPLMSREAALAARPVLCAVGARPNYMKMAPILRALKAEGIPALLVHTGQHFDASMSSDLFRALELPEPDESLKPTAGDPATQLAEIMLQFDPLITRHRPRCVLVVGDVNSTLACALVAAKRGVPVAHVEAGLRSFDRAMPEEINRLVTDQLADILYTTEASAAANLAREGVDPARTHFVGNVMIDSLLACLPHAISPREVLQHAHADTRVLDDPAGFALATFHRPGNVDQRETLSALLSALVETSSHIPIIAPLHPRTDRNIDHFGLRPLLDTPRIVCLPPVGYLEMLGLMSHAKLVLTDSGGLQEETTALGVPCLTLRENTERPITVMEGTNTLVGLDRDAIRAGVASCLAGRGKRGRRPALWDGHAALRIARHLREWLARSAV